jgi:hypothetical protein
MVILAFPYLLMASARAGGRDMGGVVPWIVGILAGVGLSIKPHFLLFWLAVEAILAVRRGWRMVFRPEALAIAAVGLSYAVAILTITPDYLPWIQRIASIYYGAGRSSLASLASEPGSILTALALLTFWILKPRADAGRRLEVILAANLALLVVAVLQIKGFSYQFYPAMATAVLLLGWLLVEFADPPASLARIVFFVRVVVVLLMVSVLASRVRESIGWRGRPDQSDTNLGRMIRVSLEQARGGSVFAFSPALAASFPMVNYSGVGWASRHPALLFLPGCYPEASGTGQAVPLHRPDQMREGERFLFDSVINRLLEDRPMLLFVDETGTPLAFEGRKFDYLGYYAQDPRFAQFLRDYEPFTEVDQFQVYRRKARIAP